MTLVGKRMSVSTEYTMIIKNAGIPAADKEIPKKLMRARGITISAKAAKTTAMLGTKVLNKVKMTKDMSINEAIKA
jgi:hypothetical protein